LFLQGKPLFPGKSDLDQLFLICKNLGELTPNHIQLFNGNKFYAGLTIPNPGAPRSGADPYDF
jgi:cyclin-dependent kinase-like